MDDFREWLSDNLRYIMLGLGIVLVLAILFFGIRFLTNKLSDDEGKENKPPQTQQSDVGSEPTPEVTVSPTPTEEPEEGKNLLEKGVYPEVNALMHNYYAALSSRDVETLRGILDGFSQEDSDLIVSSDYIQGYQNVETYTKKGLKDGEYVVFAAYDLKFVNIDTALPGLSQLYVFQDENGALKIAGEAMSEERESYMEQICQDEDVKTLISDVQLRADAAREGDPALSTFLGELGI